MLSPIAHHALTMIRLETGIPCGRPCDRFGEMTATGLPALRDIRLTPLRLWRCGSRWLLDRLLAYIAFPVF